MTGYFKLVVNGSINVPKMTLLRRQGIHISETKLDGKSYIIELLPEFHDRTYKMKTINKIFRDIIGWQHKRLTLPVSIIFTKSKIWYKMMVDKKLLPTVGKEASPDIVLGLVKALKENTK